MTLKPTSFIRLVAIALGIVAGILVAGVAIAARNSAGTYSLPAGNPVTTGTTITTTWANNTLSDLGTEVTSSLDRSGRGGMLAPLRTVDGTVAAPAHSFTNESGTGLYRIGANDIGFAVGGVKTHEWTATGETVTGLLTVTGGINRPGFEQVSSSCGTFSTTSGTSVDVTNLSVSITTTGRPVVLAMVSAPGASASSVSVSTATTTFAYVSVIRGGSTTVLSALLVGTSSAAAGVGDLHVGAPGLLGLDAVAAGTYTYKIQASVTNGQTLKLNNLVLVVWEL